jgi:serine/threonine protein kinase/Tol biopolymer transport system component
MTLAPGTKLGPYEILSPLGAGGMGEVYRARDTRLGRDVAVKVLPHHLSTNPEVRARFEREAKTVSSLNHPHICVLHDVGREGDTDFLVMELIDGETLAARVARGPLPAADVLKFGAQIADALDRAHRAGVVHRDLKPGNVMLTKSGAKLMDFGLARGTGMAASTGSGASLLTQSPTVAQPLTAEGTIIGTFQYMAPEQLEGRETDARTDIWALGCVLYEMATGVRAFEGKSQASLIATIMHTDPRPLREAAPASPPSLDRLIRECLAKDPEERRQSAGDIRRELNRIAREPEAPAASPPSARPSRARWIGASLIVGAIAAMAGFFAGHRAEKTAEAPRVAFTIPAPPGSRFRFTIEEDGTRLAPPVISPDGTQIVFGLVDAKGVRTLVRRALDDTEVHPMLASMEGRMPFWSPDGQTLGFFADGKLRKVALSGGTAVALAEGTLNARGAAWGRNGTILYAPNANSPIYSVAETGGTPVQVTFPDTNVADISHRFPVILPDQEHFLFLVWTNNSEVRDSIGGIYMGSLGSREVKRIVSAASNAVYVNHELVFARDGVLVRGPFDPRDGTLGVLTTTQQRVDWDPSTGLALFDVSPTGTLLCRESNALAQSRLVWFDRTGAPLDTVSVPANYRQIGVARNANRAAVCIGNPDANGDIWLLDFTRGLASRFTNRPADEGDPLLSSDGKTVAFTSDIGGPYHAFMGPADQSRPAEKVSPPSDDWNLLDISDDGHLVLLAMSTHIWVVDLETRESLRWHTVAGSFASSAAGFSPDTRWIVYASPESGRDEVYVRSYPGPGGQVQVSTRGGTRPHWSNDGREIVYLDPDGDLIAVPVDTRKGFDTGVPRRMFRIGTRMVWAASGDHSRFLVAVRGRDAVDPPLRVVTHWLAPAP